MIFLWCRLMIVMVGLSCPWEHTDSRRPVMSLSDRGNKDTAVFPWNCCLLSSHELLTMNGKWHSRDLNLKPDNGSVLWMFYGFQKIYRYCRDITKILPTFPLAITVLSKEKQTNINFNHSLNYNHYIICSFSWTYCLSWFYMKTSLRPNS